MFGKLVPLLAGCFVGAATFAVTALAEKRVALVIGNSAYAKTGKLANPPNDARAIADLLQRAGFDISEARLDLGLAAFKRELSDFEVNSKGADIAAFYFSGHGVQINNQDYLLPVDAELARDVDVQDEAVTLDRVLRATEGARRLRLVIIDACRDNPFVARMKNVVATRALTRGLAPPAVELADTLIAFAARDGTQAIDGAPGANSPFAAAILRRLAEPGLDVQVAFRQVRDDVRSATNGKQGPYTYGSLGGGAIALLPLSQPTAPSLAPSPPSEPRPDETAWGIIKDTTDTAQLRRFIQKFPQSPHQREAEAALAAIEAVPAHKPEQRPSVTVPNLSQPSIEHPHNGHKPNSPPPPKTASRRDIAPTQRPTEGENGKITREIACCVRRALYFHAKNPNDFNMPKGEILRICQTQIKAGAGGMCIALSRGQ